MNTEKRLILCFALSMLIVFAFSWLNAKSPGNQKSDGQVSSSTTTSRTTIASTSPELSTTSSLISESTATAAVIPPPASSQNLNSWDSLPASWTDSATREIVVESPLYRVVFSSQGGIPISWKLVRFKELLEDHRYLKLQADRGTQAIQQLAQLELQLLQNHQRQGDQFVEAIDSLFPEGRAGFLVRWGRNRSDEFIPYTCTVDRIQVTQPTPLTFVYDANGLTLEKTFRFFPDSYHLELEIRIANNSEKEITFPQNEFYDFVWQGGFGFPSMRKDAKNTVQSQLDGSTVNTPIDGVIKQISGNFNNLLPEYQSSQTELLTGKNVNWIGAGQTYFLAAIVPKTPTQLALQGIASPGLHAMGDIKPQVGVRMMLDSFAPGTFRTDKFVLYVGPMNEDDLAKPGEGLEEARQIFLRSIIGPIAHIMLRLLQGMYKIIPNYGLAIIVLTLLMKVLMFPIYQKQIKTTKKMQALQPQINALKEKYKNDQQKLQKEQMELFRKHKVNPLSGCLTMLTTIPIFIALYATFAMAVELRGAPFIGWIQDLSAPDGAFFVPIASYIIPVNILPVAYAVLMLWSTSQQSMEGPNATAMKIMPLIFVFFFWSIASGVILYFVVSIFIDVVQRLIMDKLKGDGLTPAKAEKA